MWLMGGSPAWGTCSMEARAVRWLLWGVRLRWAGRNGGSVVDGERVHAVQMDLLIDRVAVVGETRKEEEISTYPELPRNRGNICIADGGRSRQTVGHDDEFGSNRGRAYIFDVVSGTEVARLTAADGLAGDFFGYDAAISGNTAVVSAIRNEVGQRSGSIYVFDLSDINSISQTKITAFDALSQSLDLGFGYWVDIDGSPVGVGSALFSTRRGAAYICNV